MATGIIKDCEWWCKELLLEIAPSITMTRIRGSTPLPCLPQSFAWLDNFLQLPGPEAVKVLRNSGQRNICAPQHNSYLNRSEQYFHVCHSALITLLYPGCVEMYKTTLTPARGGGVVRLDHWMLNKWPD